MILVAAGEYYYSYKCSANSGAGSYSSYKRYEDMAKSTNYHVRFYILRPSVDSAYQNLIVARRLDTSDRITEVNIDVNKIWNDSGNIYGNRPNEITVKLYQNGSDTGNSLTLNSENGWSGTFSNLESSTGYSIKEIDVPDGYTVSYSGSVSSGFTITNTLQTTSISVTKVWSDENNVDGIRPSSANVTLYENGIATNKTATLNSSNSWKYTFSNLPKYKEGNEIAYTVQETVPNGYTNNISGSASTGFTITNTHVPEKVSVIVKKSWEDQEDSDELRKPITVTLYANGKPITKNAFGETITNPVTISSSDNWTYTFTDLFKYANGQEITYSVIEDAIYTEKNSKGEIPYSNPKYESTQDEDGNKILTITNSYTSYYDGYVEISGKVWIDKPDGKGNSIDGVYIDKNIDNNSRDILKEGITVRLKYIDENGNHQLFNPNLQNVYEAKTNSNGEYIIRVNYDNSKNVYKLYEDVATVNKKLETSYVEFEYDGIRYTTVATKAIGDNTSKATENETTRNTFDSNHATVTSETIHPDNSADKNITAVTNKIISYEAKDENKEVVIKYCNGNGTYIRTNPEGAWKDILSGTKDLACNNGQGHELNKHEITVRKITNINLGLFEREQPDVAIFSDLTKVEVEMNNQKYTYLYGVKNNNPDTPEGLKVKFQNKNTYTYRRPVNPADIAYIQEETDSNKMSVKVTYEIKVANLSSTLKIKVDKIANYFDNNYTLNTNGWTETTSGGEFKKVTKDNLNIILDPLSQSAPIELTYTVNEDTIKGLLNQEATLNNAVEIEKYSTYYGATTIYAEERKGERTGKPYAGYDFDSHPGDANIKLRTGSDGVERLYSTDINGNIIPIDKLQDDTDMAPSFVLCLAEKAKTLAGTVWEDKKDEENCPEDERLGNGKIDNGEKQMQNVKVELYNLDGSLAKLYNIDGTAKNKDAVTYTSSNGYYELEGVVTGEYYLKFTYGDDTTELKQGATTMDGGETTVNARDYKSTIIKDEKVKNILNKDYVNFSDEEKKWHITHTPGYSVAVDNMLDRLDIPDLQYSNFKEGYTEPQNMTAYTKPFKTQIEFETSGQAQAEGTTGSISGVTNVLNNLDFGIAERPRENLYSQKTISYIKVRLANGQYLTEGDPRTQNLSYVKAMGFGQKINSGAEARAAMEKQLLIEIDAELIQGAQLEIDYEVTVTNDNEKDYDYGDVSDYSDIDVDNNNYITKSSKANYYYYGDSNGLEEMKAAIEFVDYLSSEVVYNADINTDWKYKNINELKQNELISTDVKNFIEENSYNVLVSNVEGSIDGKVTLARGASLERPLKMSVSKLLSNQAENVYDNGMEIIKIDGKTARTIQESQNGIQIEKEYKPGNYIPNVLSKDLEQDDDRVKVIITPPTGIMNYIITYVITGLVGLVIIIVGIVFIKKKVLTR